MQIFCFCACDWTPIFKNCSKVNTRSSGSVKTQDVQEETVKNTMWCKEGVAYPLFGLESEL